MADSAVSIKLGVKSDFYARAQKVDLIPVVDKAPTKVVGVETSEGVAYAYEKAK